MQHLHIALRWCKGLLNMQHLHIALRWFSLVPSALVPSVPHKA